MPIHCLLVICFASLCTGFGGQSINDFHSGVQALRGLTTPFPIGHRGLGSNPNYPIENTVESVEKAYQAGLKVVEIDVVMTADNQVVVHHDDILEDSTCVNQLTLSQLLEKLDYVATLAEILSVTHDNNGGILIIEIKTPAPVCDPGDVKALPLTAATMKVVKQAGMENQVVIDGFSPEMIQHAKKLAPSVSTSLGLNTFQIIPSSSDEPIPPTEKNVLGLKWYDIQGEFRLAGYRSLEEYLNLTKVIGAEAATMDARVFLDGKGALSAVEGAGVMPLLWTALQQHEWDAMAQLGPSGIFADAPISLKN